MPICSRPRFFFTIFVFQTNGGLADDAVTRIDQFLRHNSSNIPYRYTTLKYQAMSEMLVATLRENGNIFFLCNLFDA